MPSRNNGRHDQSRLTARSRTAHAWTSLCPLVDGAPGRELKNPIMLDWLRARAAEAETVTAVCTGSMLLGFAGLLEGLHATTHWRSLDWMRDSFPSVTVEYGKHFVVDGRVFTSAGISAGIDMSLKVVARYFGEDIARATARHMEYPYPESDARRIQIRAQRSASLFRSPTLRCDPITK